jgi:hypothetical protein
MRYFKAKEQMDLWKILFFDNFQDEINTRAFTEAELKEHAKTRKIKLTFIEPTDEQKGLVPEDTILIFIPGAKLSTIKDNTIEEVSRVFCGEKRFFNSTAYAEYLLEQLRSKTYLKQGTDYQRNFLRPGSNDQGLANCISYGGTELYYLDTTSFRKNPAGGSENSPCIILDTYLQFIANNTSLITRLFYEIPSFIYAEKGFAQETSLTSSTSSFTANPAAVIKEAEVNRKRLQKYLGYGALTIFAVSVTALYICRNTELGSKLITSVKELFNRSGNSPQL